MNHAPPSDGGPAADAADDPDRSATRPRRWAVSNWPVRWKVLAIVIVPLVLAATLGGLRIYSAAADAADLRRDAERADVVPAVVDYMGALEGAMVAATNGGDTRSALADYDQRKAQLRQRLDAAPAVPDVRRAVTDLLDSGQDLVNKVTANALDLRARITSYAPLLLTAETAITGSVLGDGQQVQVQAEGLARAVGARGQMTMQQVLVDRGGDLPEPVLRTSMITLAGTEPSTISGMSQLLGGGSQQAATLRAQLVRRMAILSDPAQVLAGNPALRRSQQTTRGIAEKIIADTAGAIPAAVHRQATAQRNAAIRDAVLVGAALLVALVVVLLVARSLVRPLRRLRDSALKVAHEDLVHELEQVRSGAEPEPVTPVPVYTSEEVGQVAHAVDELHEQAVFLAGEQARLQLQVGDMFETLSRRSRSLVDQQLALIDRLERNEQDPERLESLFRLDHLAARMRRNGANLLVLAGARVPREQAAPVAVAAVVNAAASEVEDYTRVVTDAVPDSEIVGAVAADLVHLLAELLDNALRYSPPGAPVRVAAVHTADGALVIEVSDEGLGMTESDLRMANARLQSGGEVDPYAARHMGLFVVSRLAAQHALVVRLRSTAAGEPHSGTTAGVHVPADAIVGAAEPEPSGGRHEAPASAAVLTASPRSGRHEAPADQRNGHAELDRDPGAGGLPQRRPGASGIAGVPPLAAPPVSAPAPEETHQPSSTAGADDAIYQKMLSEWLIDPTELAHSTDLDWQSVWDHGWSAAAAAEEQPVHRHTEHGLPMREPGARLVPGAPGSEEPVASAADRGSGHPEAESPGPRRDPEAVRASIGNHFGGVRAGRSHARGTGGTDQS